MTPYLSTDIATKLAASELRQRNLGHEEEFYLLVNADDVLDLASGCVPRKVQAMATTLVEWEDMLRRNAERPTRRVKRPPQAIVPPRRRRGGSS